MNSRSRYDVAIIGAGLSGLAAGIRLAHFGRRVCIFERHNAVGGLNGFYSLGGRKFDVGLHAVTNFVSPEVKGTPLGKILRQLRIDRAELDLCPQKGSRVAFGPRGETQLRFGNDFSLLEEEVARLFPRQADGFRAVAGFVRERSFAPDGLTETAREFLRRHLTDPLLEDMLLCPILFYGGARENDLDLDQFAIMFRALFLEGFARPFEGVRPILRVLLEKYRAAGGERRMKCGVREIVARQGRAAVLLLDSGEEIAADHILSSIGSEETAALIRGEGASEPAPTAARTAASSGVPDPAAASESATASASGEGASALPASSRRLAFVETIAVLNRAPAALGWGDDTIVFFNESSRFRYEQPAEPVDTRSGILCFPNNFLYGPGRELSEGYVRCTCLASYDAWSAFPEPAYQAAKRRWFEAIQSSALRFLPPLSPSLLSESTVATDMFTPRTVRHYTGHLRGAIYGSPKKNPSGRTSLSNLYLCGTDQGLLGIIGAMLSGITMANQHILHR